jgi:conjugal transfer pilus assembly protein TrbC
MAETKLYIFITKGKDMVKKIGIVLALLCNQNAWSMTASVFVSFSMPNNLMEAVLADAAQHGICVYLNGLIDDDLRKTLAHILTYAQKYPSLSMQIDPVAFEKYHIDRVPALVVEEGRQWDVLYGNVRLEDGLLWLKRKGDIR